MKSQLISIYTLSVLGIFKSFKTACENGENKHRNQLRVSRWCIAEFSPWRSKGPSRKTSDLAFSSTLPTQHTTFQACHVSVILVSSCTNTHHRQSTRIVSSLFYKQLCNQRVVCEDRKPATDLLGTKCLDFVGLLVLPMRQC